MTDIFQHLDGEHQIIHGAEVFDTKHIHDGGIEAFLWHHKSCKTVRGRCLISPLSCDLRHNNSKRMIFRPRSLHDMIGLRILLNTGCTGSRRHRC